MTVCWCPGLGFPGQGAHSWTSLGESSDLPSGLLQERGKKVEEVSESSSVMSDSLQPHELYSPWNSPGQNTGVGSLCLLQGIFPTQGSNPDLLHYRQILYQLSHIHAFYSLLDCKLLYHSRNIFVLSFYYIKLNMEGFLVLNMEEFLVLPEDESKFIPIFIMGNSIKYFKYSMFNHSQYGPVVKN